MGKIKKYADLVFTAGEYEVNGVKKKRYVNVGTMFVNTETKQLTIKLESCPISPDWSGWLSVFIKKTKQAEKVDSVPSDNEVDF